MTKFSTQATEDYLKTIYLLGGGGGREVTTGAIAGHLGVAQPSATNMVKRLARAGLVRHAPYRAVRLTERGRTRARLVVRRHRLLELYLKDVLGLGLADVHGEADRLEHALSDLLEARLDELLGHPSRDPHGEPIPRGRAASP